MPDLTVEAIDKLTRLVNAMTPGLPYVAIKRNETYKEAITFLSELTRKHEDKTLYLICQADKEAGGYNVLATIGNGPGAVNNVFALSELCKAAPELLRLARLALQFREALNE